jgi:hypothetical protein
MVIYTYTIPNQWKTKVQSLKPGLTRYIRYGDTYQATNEAGLRELVALYRQCGKEVETGYLE